MFLPIVLFIPNAFYYGFNEHATNSETTTINYKYQSNEVNSPNDLVEGNIYSYSSFEVYVLDRELQLYFNILQYNNIYLPYDTQSIGEVIYDAYNANIRNELTFSYYNDGQTSYADFFFTNLDTYSDITFDLDTSDSVIFTNLIFVCSDNFIDHIQEIDEDLQNGLPTYTDYNVIESVEINTDDTISNKMYQAWLSTWNLPLLQWTHTSFVASPFTYITGLFGVPSDSTLNYIFAYFVSISICWLVFDLLMYVPNLAHRWLDKGALE